MVCDWLVEGSITKHIPSQLMAVFPQQDVIETRESRSVPEQRSTDLPTGLQSTREDPVHDTGSQHSAPTPKTTLLRVNEPQNSLASMLDVSARTQPVSVQYLREDTGASHSGSATTI